MLRILQSRFLVLLLLGSIHSNTAIVLDINRGSTSYPIQDTQPLGISFEFSEFPAYMNELKQTKGCLSNLESALGAPTSIRIGGTSQDFATFEPNLHQAIKFSPPTKPGALPQSITFGPEFIRLAAKLPGSTTLGLNRRMNNIDNVATVTKLAMSEMKNLYAIELGNEPEYYGSKAPVAKGAKWTPEEDVKSQIKWQKELSEKIGKDELIQAGVYLSPPRWSISHLAPQIKEPKYIKSFGLHAYPQTVCGNAKTNLPNLMSHINIQKFVKRFESEVSAAKKLGKPLHFSETNTATCQGGDASKTFGAALWLIDYTFQSLILGVNRLYFHQATIAYSRYNFWNKQQVNAPYYGAYFTALALKGASHISIMKTSDPSIAAYVLYRCQRIIRIVAYNSDLIEGVQQDANLEVPSLPPRITSARLLRLTAPSATVTKTGGQNGPQIGNSFFENHTCKINATPQWESIPIEQKTLYFSVRSSEAVLIEFNDGAIQTC